MKYFFLLVVVVTFFFPHNSWAQAGWDIDQFQSDITVEADGSVDITETIEVDFHQREKHGIFRDIPYVYEGFEGETIYSRITDIEVTQDGNEAKVDIDRTSANIRIRIGDEDEVISGKHTYTISYSVIGVLQSFESFDELNWNVTGDDWEATIEHVSATIHVAAPIKQATCYQGMYGSTTPCASSEFSEDTATFTAHALSPGENLTVAVGYTPGIIPLIIVEKPLTLFDALFSRVALMAGTVVLVGGIFIWLRRWYRYGRDRYWQRAHLPGVRSDRTEDVVPEKILPLGFKQPVSVEYDAPDNLRPAELGVVMDEAANTLDVSATIVDLAVRGYLTITEIPKKWRFGSSDYELARTDKAVTELRKYESVLLEKLFTDGTQVKISDLKNTFYQDLKTVKDLLYKDVIEKKLFAHNPARIRGIYVGVSITIIAAGGILFGLLAVLVQQATALELHHTMLAGLSIGLFLSGILGLCFSPFMPRKTAYGREIYQRTKGYELFVSGTEKYRAKFLEREGIFMEVLPYAIVFGVTDQLARAFKELGIKPPAPSWYHGVAPFHPALFASNMESFSSSLSSAIASAPSSSGSGGGGFSGGGFGGGGGGSW